MSGSARRDARRAETAERRARALRLRKAGHTYDSIARVMGLSHRGDAHHLVQDAIRDISREPAEQVRELELARLDDLQRAPWMASLKGDLHALDRVLRIMERRASYLGLEQARAVQVHVEESETERSERIARLRAVLSALESGGGAA